MRVLSLFQRNANVCLYVLRNVIALCGIETIPRLLENGPAVQIVWNLSSLSLAFIRQLC